MPLRERQTFRILPVPSMMLGAEPCDIASLHPRPVQTNNNQERNLFSLLDAT